MLQPTKSRSARSFHTHLVRGGSLMLRPTGRRRTAGGARSPAAYPPRQRWVLDVTAYSRKLWSNRFTGELFDVGCSINHPPLTRWVCRKPARGGFCRLQHQEPTSDEVGMKSRHSGRARKLTRYGKKSCKMERFSLVSRVMG